MRHRRALFLVSTVAGLVLAVAFLPYFFMPPRVILESNTEAYLQAIAGNVPRFVFVQVMSAVGALLCTLVIFAVFGLLSSERNRVFLQWSTYVGVLGFSILIIRAVTNLSLHLRLARAFAAGEAAVLPAALGVELLDPSLALQLLSAAYWVVVVSVVGFVRRRLHPAAVVAGLVYVLVGAAAFAVLGSGEAPGVARLLLFVVLVVLTPLWWIFLGLSFLRQRP